MMILFGILVIVSSALIMGLVGTAMHRDRRCCGPAFRQMSACLGLTVRHRLQLWRLARRAGLMRPAALLVSRGCFEHAVRRCPGHGLSSKDVETLRTRIFE